MERKRSFVESRKLNKNKDKETMVQVSFLSCRMIPLSS